MRWSQLKKRLENRFAESVQGRVQLAQTRYRRANEQEGEFWVTVDAKKVFGLSTGACLELQGSLVYEYHKTHAGSSWGDAYHHAEPMVEASGQIILEELNSALFETLNLTVEECLRHHIAVVRGLALLDRRMGKRRLPVNLRPKEHPFVSLMNQFRCESEGISLEPSDSGSWRTLATVSRATERNG